MRYQVSLSFALLLFWSSPYVAHSANLRYFSFPTEYPVGALQLMGNEKEGIHRFGRAIGIAQGSFSVEVPPGSTVLLELNPRCLEHPERLKNIKTAGINRLKIAYLSMDDNDHSLCDKALQTLPEFKDLISLNVERSDTTDKGLAGFKSLPSVKFLSAFGAAVEGPILKETPRLRVLERLNLQFNPLKSENFKYLSALPHLTELVISQSNLLDDDLKNLPKCSQLKRLDIGDNHKLTDKSLPAVKQQTALENLNVRGTGISFAGLLTLKDLKLTTLILSIKRYRPDELADLKKAFPKAVLDYRGNGIATDNQTLFSPLK
ncbi:MAG: hypothetical protein P4L53_11535 [Candidatus Obscuribacterales bacterium]|nr:hypothetical protein [Candidatus Obscuribacterales bacterium]